LRANGSRECAPDDRLREAIHTICIANDLDCFRLRPAGYGGRSRRFAPRKKPALGKAAATIKTVVARLDRAIQYAAASHLSQTSLEYWVARSSRAMTAVFVSFIRVGSKVGTELAMTKVPFTPDAS
jgi:hypothetical protein